MATEPPHFSRLAERLIADLRGVPDATPARMRRRPTRELAGLVDELLAKHQIGVESVAQTIRDHWPELVGPAIAEYSHAAQVDARGKLVVLVTHSVVREELFTNRELIVKRIQALPKCGQVRGLVLRNG